ncbi:MAG: hypothetical protein Q9224_003539 [Gallowayella concinna]
MMPLGPTSASGTPRPERFTDAPNADHASVDNSPAFDWDGAGNRANENGDHIASWDNDGMDLDDQDGDGSEPIHLEPDEELCDSDHHNECGEDYDGEGSDFDEFEEFRWLKSLNVDYKAANGESIGHCHAKIIDRDSIRQSFYHDMEEPSEDTAALAFGLFDRWGSLKMEFCEHPVKKGTGVWGQELSHGRFLLIETVSVDKNHRRQGHGKILVDKVWEKARSIYPDLQYAIAWATNLNSDVLEVKTRNMTSEARHLLRHEFHMAVEDFFRAVGFRRIGSSPWFARAEDPTHPSRSLAASGDYKRPMSLHLPALEDGQTHPYDAAMLNLEKEVIKVGLDWQPRSRARRSILKTNDERTLEIFKDRLTSFPATDPIWNATDNAGNTIMHVVAIDCKVKSLTWLLANSFAGRLKTTRNLEGETPLEALEVALEKQRVQTKVGMVTVPISDQFVGFQPEEMTCLLRLRGFKTVEQSTIAQTKYGCTCGECVGGFLSPRLSLAMGSQARLCHDLIMTYGGSTKTGAEWCEALNDLMDYIPPVVRPYLRTNKSLRAGFTNLFVYVARCIEAKCFPLTANVMLFSEWPPHANYFLKRGGTVASVVLRCFDQAMAEDLYLGGGDHQEAFSEEIEKLKPCRNDHEFAFVRRQYCQLEGLTGDAAYERGTQASIRMTKYPDVGSLRRSVRE